jgi:hypothetical protein
MNAPPTGVIQGGWEFVIAAYVATAVILLGYAGSVLWRYRHERNHDHDDAR